jgi:hypothetical protein
MVHALPEECQRLIRQNIVRLASTQWRFSGRWRFRSTAAFYGAPRVAVHPEIGHDRISASLAVPSPHFGYTAPRWLHLRLQSQRKRADHF